MRKEERKSGSNPPKPSWKDAIPWNTAVERQRVDIMGHLGDWYWCATHDPRANRIVGWMPKSRLQVRATRQATLTERESVTASQPIPSWIQDLIIDDPDVWWFAEKKRRKKTQLLVNIVANCCRPYQLVGTNTLEAQPPKDSSSNGDFTPHSGHKVTDLKVLPDKDGSSTSLWGCVDPKDELWIQIATWDDMVVRISAVCDVHIAIGRNTVMPKLHSKDGAFQWMVATKGADDLTVLSYKMRDPSTRMSHERPGNECTEVAYNQLNGAPLHNRTQSHK
jgi:hypothetical protein